jgi:hypothetical protein
MRIEQLTVELRPRSPWEAVELGMALVRRHAAAIWVPWLLASGAVFALANLAGWWLEALPLAALLMWWLKPVFDRIPLFVVSRAVFGDTPTPAATLAAQRHWGWRPMLHYLTWRRLGPARALYLPVDLLEGGAGGERRRVIGGGARGVAVATTVVCAHFEMALALGVLALGLLFVPVEFLSEAARAAWALVATEPPPWAQLVFNAVAWLATTVVEPFYAGAGFGLYLNRRTQVEAWDLEIAFRRMRRRVAAVAVVVACACVLGPLALPARAAETPPATTDDGGVEQDDSAQGPAVTLDEVFGPRLASEGGFRRAVDTAMADPLLHPRRREVSWQPRNPGKPGDPHAAAGPIAAAIARGIAFLAESGLWILLAIGAVALLRTWRRWVPWLRGLAPEPAMAPEAPTVTALVDAGALPADLVAAIRAAWAQGRQRQALALLYRGSVEAMAARTGIALVPGATEAECLRAARALQAPADREAFAEAVRVWQYAAYAGALPDASGFDALLARLAQRFGWAA